MKIVTCNKFERSQISENIWIMLRSNQAPSQQ